jgi:hypothetical protein
MITTSIAFMRWNLHRALSRVCFLTWSIIDQGLRRLRAGWWCVLAITCLSGCSMVQTVYNRGPDLAYWWIDGFVDVSSEQRPLLTEDLQQYQLWHRTTQLPRYAQWLKELQTLALQDVTEEQSCKLYGDIWEGLLGLAEPAEAGTLRLVRTLSGEQIDHLRQKIERHHRNWRRDWVEPGPNENLDKRVKRAQERAEDVYGRLDAQQLRLLRQQAERSPYDLQLAEAMRLRRQDDIVTTLRGLQRQPVTTQAYREQIHALLQRSVRSPVAEHQAYVTRLNEYNCNSLAQLHNSTSAEQRQAALKRLQKYERDARALMTP